MFSKKTKKKFFLFKIVLIFCFCIEEPKAAGAGSGSSNQWFEKISLHEYKSLDPFTFFKGIVFHEVPLKIGDIEFNDIIWEKMIMEKKLRSLHENLKTKENFAQYQMAAIYEGEGGIEVFSIPISLSDDEESRAFYANGTMGVLSSGFEHDIDGYPWIARSKTSSDIFLIQRPSSTPDMTKKTVELLKELTNDQDCPATVSVSTLDKLIGGFEEFEAIKPRIKDFLLTYFKNAMDLSASPEGDLVDSGALEKSFTDLKSYMIETRHDASSLDDLLSIIMNMRFDLEGRYFEIIKKQKVLEIDSQIDIEKQKCTDILEGIKRVGDDKAELRRLHMELNQKPEIASLSKKKSLVNKVFTNLQGLYVEIIKYKKLTNLCNPKDFNFGCSEQLLIDHLFASNLDATVSYVIEKAKDRPLKQLVLLIHSTMTPCKTCSLDIALEFERGRIADFFRQVEESLGVAVDKTVVVSFEKEYFPASPEKNYGFVFTKNPSMAKDKFYWLVDGLL